MLKFLTIAILISLLGLFNPFVFAQDSSIQECKDNNKSVQDCPEFLKSKLNLLAGQSKSLSSQIAIMDSQINLTVARIEANKREILDLTLDIDTATKKISTLQDSLNKITEVLLNRIVATYEAGRAQPLEMLLSSHDASNLLVRLNYLRIAQAHDKKLIYDVAQAKNDYSNQKDIYEAKRKKVESLKRQLEAYNNQLSQEKQSKQDLLAQTQGSETTYQQLLAQAQAQLNALSNFANSRTGGVQIIPHSDKQDEWGKYYNQRDSSWGNNLIGTSGERVWAVGCLLTSYAMVSSHFGASMSPLDVAGNSSNFWFSTALFLKPGPAANGHGAQVSYSPSFDYLRDQLNNGHAVIAGLSYDGGPIADHWLVLRSPDEDSFKVNDPLYEGAMNVSLNDHYKGLKIVEARIY